MTTRPCRAQVLIRDDEGNPLLDDDGNEQHRPCKLRAGKGSLYCNVHVKSHGSNPGQLSKVRHAEDILRMNMGQLAEQFGTEAETDPMMGILALIRRSSAMVAAFGYLVDQHQASAAWTQNPETQDTKAHALLTMYGEWIDRNARVCKLALDAGIEERSMRLAEQMGRLLAGTLEVVMDRLELTPEQLQRAPDIIAEELRHMNALPAPSTASLPS